MTRRSWIGVHAEVTQKRQCVLASVVRGTVYAQRKPQSPNEGDEVLKRLIDEGYTRHPFYGSRKMVVHLGRCGHINGYATMGELLIGLTNCFVFYNGHRPHQALGNQTPNSVHANASGGGAMIVDKYGLRLGLPIALRSTGTALEEVRIENESTIQNAKIWAAPSCCVKSGAA